MKKSEDILTTAKACTKCGMKKPLSEFYKRKNSRIGFSSACKSCTILKCKAYRKFHPELGREYRRNHRRQRCEQWKAWKTRHPDVLRKIEIKYRLKNHLQILERHRKWKIDNPQKYKLIRRRFARKYNATTRGNIERKIRGAMWRSLRSNNTGSYWEKLLGYTLRDLRRHLESKFTEGMNWDLFLRGEIHLDHIIPVSRLYFDSYNDPSFRFCFSLKNLQPLWKKDNIEKRAKIA